MMLKAYNPKSAIRNPKLKIRNSKLTYGHHHQSYER